MGFAIHRQARHLASILDENSVYGDDAGDRPMSSQIRPVPIWLCVFLVIGYIIGGGFLFMNWEGWNYLDSVYFCFITLTTIGECFGPIFSLKFTHECHLSQFLRLRRYRAQR
jgi:hypothetical protein